MSFKQNNIAKESTSERGAFLIPKKKKAGET